MRLPKFCFLKVNSMLHGYIINSGFFDSKTNRYKLAQYSFEVMLDTEIPYFFSMIEDSEKKSDVQTC